MFFSLFVCSLSCFLFGISSFNAFCFLNISFLCLYLFLSKFPLLLATFCECYEINIPFSQNSLCFELYSSSCSKIISSKVTFCSFSLLFFDFTSNSSSLSSITSFPSSSNSKSSFSANCFLFLLLGFVAEQKIFFT